MDYFFITGSSRGIGEALAKKVLEQPNTKVIGISRSCTIDQPQYKHLFIDFSNIEKLIEETESIFINLEDADKIILVNNAATLAEVGYVGKLKNQNIKKIFDVNTTAPIILINSFLAKYKSLSSTKIILNISSGAATYPMDGWSGYSASKAALEMFSKTVAIENESNKGVIKIFAVSPGIVDTAMQAEVREVNKDQFSGVEKFRSYKSSGKLTQPVKVAEKLLALIENPDHFKDVILDIRVLP